MPSDTIANSKVSGTRPATLAIFAFVLAVAGALVVALSGLGNRWGFWGFRTGLSALRYGTYIAIAALAFSLVTVFVIAIGHRRGTNLAILSLVIGLVTAGLPLSTYRTARKLPPIHDVTTDTDNPPQFVAVLPLRVKALNPVKYGGPAVAAKQKSAYPDIVPIQLSLPPEQVFDRALAAAREMGWDIVASDSVQGRIEATATTFWFGFKDDVVIRIAPDNNGSRVDIRSLSRVGGGDVGTNAKRIRAFMAKLRSST
jgi:uncharacterized protein (DUF1499 family)